MVVINKDTFDETRIGKTDDSTQWLPQELLEELTAAEPAAHDVTDATQRVYLDTNSRSADASAANYNTASQKELRANIAARSAERRASAAREKKRKQRLILISVCAAAAIVLIGVIILLISLAKGSSKDDGLIKNNVYAAGVDLSGLTVDQAREKLHAETDGTYSTFDMTVSILDTVITLSPADTGASLDVDAVVEAAYNCGRTGSAADSYTVSIVPYLNLNESYIQSVIDELGEKYSTTLTQTTYEIQGDKPKMQQELYDTSVTYQTMYVQIGTAEYGLNVDSLYEQIMDAYEINLFEVSCQCTVVAPDPLDYEAIYNELCIAPVNAVMDTATYEVTPEVYGYGFTVEELKTAVEGAEYGSTVEVPLHFIEPDITADFYSNDMFQDTLASYAAAIPTTEGWSTNLDLVCQAINGTILKAGEEFSFNEIVGRPTADAGYQSVSIYLGKSYQAVVGGGNCQAASMLYYCALMADLEILERVGHAYAVDFIQSGFDAEISYGSADFRFKNNTEYPIRIDASVEGGQLKIALIGTDTKDYYVRLNYETDKTYKPGTVYSTMLEGNAGGYKDGDVVTTGITGYTISTYLLKYSNSNNRLIEENLIAENYYAKRDQVVVQIYQPPVVEPEPTDPIETTQPTEPEETTQPTEPEETTQPTEPEETTQPTEPEETTEPTETTEATDPSQPVDAPEGSETAE